MKHRISLAAALAVSLVAPLPAPVSAQDEGRSLMERGAELFLEGLQQEMAPTLNDLRGLADEFGPAIQGFVREMGPAFSQLLGEVQDWSRYHPLEILPYGVIIIRRKADPSDEGVEDEATPPSGPTDI